MRLPAHNSDKKGSPAGRFFRPRQWISSRKRQETVREFGHKLKSSIFALDERFLTAFKLVFVSLLFSLFETEIQRAAYSFLTPPGYAPLYIYSNLTVPLAVGLLAGPVPALVIGLVTSLVIALLSQGSLLVFITAAASSAIAALTAPKITERKMLANVFVVAFVVQTFLSFGALFQCFKCSPKTIPMEFFVQQLLFSAFFIASSLLFLIAYLPLAEKLSGLASTMTIAKFADLNHPLLKKLDHDAPGTYRHSISVSDLAKNAAEAIGANALVARVGAYYHDIGKITHPDYYMENQTGLSMPNPHDRFAPNISRLIIMNHVRDGYCLAKSRNLPGPILRIIETHQGTSVIKGFYMKALKLSEKEGQEAAAGNGKGAALRDTPQESFFRYDGPLPRTREESIVYLADKIEAASRACPPDVSPVKLVENAVNKEIADGQLDNSELTGADLRKIKAAFVLSLKHLFHIRLPYPSEK